MAFGQIRRGRLKHDPSSSGLSLRAGASTVRKDQLAKVRALQHAARQTDSSRRIKPRVVNIQMEKRALAAEEATEAVVMERKAHSCSRAKGKQSPTYVSGWILKLWKSKKSGTKLFGSQFDKMTSNAEKSESQRKILEEYVGKLERRLGSSEGKTKSASANRDIDQRALLDVVAELQEENGKLNDALQVGKKPGMYSDQPAYLLSCFSQNLRKLKRRLKKKQKSFAWQMAEFVGIPQNAQALGNCGTRVEGKKGFVKWNV